MTMRTHHEPPRIIPPHNLFGDHGPRCPHCSGLGELFHLDRRRRQTIPALCTCDGTGVDPAIYRLPKFESILQRIHDLDRQQVRAARMRDVLSRTELDQGRMSMQSWQELIAYATTDGTAVANTTTETIIMPNVILSGNYMQNGRALRYKVAGKWSTTTGTVTHVYRIRWGGVGGTALAITGTVTLLVSITNGYFEFEVMIQTRSNGTTGTLLVDGVSKTFAATAPTIGSATGAPAIAPMTAGGQTAPAAVTVDLTADTALACTVQHGAASASNTLTGMHLTLESLN